MLYRSLADYAENRPNSIAWYLAQATKKTLLNLKALLPRQYIIRLYLNTHSPAKLHIGAGYNILPGWLNTDCSLNFPADVYLDATKRFPIDPGIFDYVFAEHVLEHLTKREGLNMLRECRRILKPNGVLRLALPDLTQIVTAYQNPMNPDAYLYLDRRRVSAIDAINQLFYDFGHQRMYDEESLRESLDVAGFSEIKRVKMGKSEHASLQDIEAKDKDRDAREFETMVLEASYH